jgi:hypothetical protein
MIAHRVTQSLPIATQRLRIRLSQTDMNSFGTSRTSSRTPPAQVLNRCVAFPVAVASDGSSIHEILRDTNGRPWPAGPAPEPPSTGAITDASTPRADGLRGGSVDPNGRVHPIDDAGQESRGGGHYGRTAPTGAPRPSERRHASPTVWSTPARTSTISCPDAILARHNERSRRFEHLSPAPRVGP